MGNRTRMISMGVLPLCICMYACLHACVLCLPNDEPTVEECTECKVSLYEEVPSGLTKRDVRILLSRYGLAYPKDIKEIKFLRAVKMVTITLSDPKVAAKIAQRHTVNYKGKILKFELNSVATRVPDLQRPSEESPKPTNPTLTFAEPTNTVAAKIAQRQTVNYKGKILKFELNSIATRVPDLQRPTEESPKPTNPKLTFPEPSNPAGDRLNVALLSGTRNDTLTEDVLKNVILSNNVAHSPWFISIKIFNNVNIAVMTLFDYRCRCNKDYVFILCPGLCSSMN